MRSLTLVLGLVTCVSLPGCRPTPDSSAYFPLDAGHHWVYQVTTEWENQVTERDFLTMSTLGSETVDGQPAWRRRSDHGVDYWLRQDDTGIYRIATKSELDEAPKLDTARRYVLKLPFQVGSTWLANTTAYLLHRRQEFPREIKHTHPAVPMNYSIEAVDQTVDTPAGQFKSCMLVKGLAVLRLYADPVVGWRDIPLQTQEWYCQGVGLVKLVREEIAASTFLSGGTYTMLLSEWK